MKCKLITIAALIAAFVLMSNHAVAQATPGAIDPATGMPVTTGLDWKDSGKTLPEVSFQGLPIEEIATFLRQKFQDSFDTIIPDVWHSPNHAGMTFDPQTITVRLQLKNVTATEIFNAMNLAFDAAQTPVHWQLTMNGNRPLALLQVIPALIPPSFAPKEPERKRMVFFVGDLLGDEKSPTMTMEQLFHTVCSVYDMAFPGGPTPASQDELKFHNEAQLLIVNASLDRVGFVQETLAALREKSQTARRKAAAPAEPNK